jgi:hypothetical protein
VHPPDPSSSTTATFGFADAEAGVTYLCKLDSGGFVPCTNPVTYTGLALGDHHIDVAAIDAAGNTSSNAGFHWKIITVTDQPLTISGDAVGLLYPGGPARSLAVRFVNPNTVPITVTTLTVTLMPGSFPAGCLSSAFGINPSNVSLALPITVPASDSVTLPDNTNAPGVNAPTVQMNDNGAPQDSCTGATFSFDYASS